MPKAPILARTAFYDVLGYDKSVRLLDWNAVETSLGPMVEPRSFEGGYGTVKVTDMDVYDSSFTRISQIDETTFANQYGTGGRQLLVDYSPQGA